MSEVTQSPEPTSYVVEGDTYRRLIAERDALRRVANDLARQLREITPFDASAPPERASAEKEECRACKDTGRIKTGTVVNGVAEVVACDCGTHETPASFDANGSVVDDLKRLLTTESDAQVRILPDGSVVPWGADETNAPQSAGTDADYGGDGLGIWRDNV